MRLIDNWRHSWKFWSIRLNVIGNMLLASLLAFPAIAQDVWHGLPDDMKALLPRSVAYWIPVTIFVAATAARLIHQEKARASK